MRTLSRERGEGAGGAARVVEADDGALEVEEVGQGQGGGAPLSCETSCFYCRCPETD